MTTHSMVSLDYSHKVNELPPIMVHSNNSSYYLLRHTSPAVTPTEMIVITLAEARAIIEANRQPLP
jgi:hypothetical protein